MSNYEYRNYMTNNAKMIMKKNMLEACKEQSAYPAIFEYHVGAPYLYTSCKEWTTPVGYENSDLKTEYLHKVRKSTT